MLLVGRRQAVAVSSVGSQSEPERVLSCTGLDLCLDLRTPGASVGLQPVEAVGEVCRGSVLEDGYGGECRTLGQLIGVFVDDRLVDDCPRLRSRVDRDLFDRKELRLWLAGSGPECQYFDLYNFGDCGITGA